jgi:hypothetical protein
MSDPAWFSIFLDFSNEVEKGSHVTFEEIGGCEPD